MGQPDPALFRDGRFQPMAWADRRERGITDEDMDEAEAEYDEWLDQRMREQRERD